MKAFLTLIFFGFVIALAWAMQWLNFPSVMNEDIEERIVANEARVEGLLVKELKQNEEGVESLTQVAGQKDAADIILDWLAKDEMDQALTVYREELAELALFPQFSSTLVDALMERERYMDAIDLMYERRLFVPFEQEEALLQQIHKEVLRVEEVLVENSDIAGVIDLYEQLIQLEADYSPYYLRLAHWQLLIGDKLRAEQSLQSARHDIRYEADVARLDAMLSDDAPEIAEESTIPLTQKDDHFAVEVDLEGVMVVRLMIDTGAGMTVVKSELLDQLYGSDVAAEEIELLTAGGKTSGQKMTVSAFGLGNQQMSNVDVVSMSLEGFEYDGLLGMNVLSQFEFQIDQAQSTLYLR